MPTTTAGSQAAAADHGSRYLTLPIEVVARMQSGDFAVLMSEILPAGYITPGSFTNDGRVRVSELADDIRQNGVSRPLKVYMGPARPVVSNGQHRYVAAALAGTTHLVIEITYPEDVSAVTEWALRDSSAAAVPARAGTAAGPDTRPASCRTSAPSPHRRKAEDMTTGTFTSAYLHVCPAGHTAPGRDWPVEMVVPDAAGLTPRCVQCQEPMVATGSQLSGSWRLDECCRPTGPDGCWARHDSVPARCTSCYGTQFRPVCTICFITNCDDQAHDFCLDCDGTCKITCPRCGGGGVVTIHAGPAPCDGCNGEGCGDCDGSGRASREQEATCPRCEGREEIECPGCGGSGKPSKRPPGPPAAPGDPAARQASPGPLPSPDSMAAGSLAEARRSAAAQAGWLSGIAEGSEQLENDLIAGVASADSATLGAVRAARESTAAAAQAWEQVGARLGRHAPGAAYASGGYAASMSFLRP